MQWAEDYYSFAYEPSRWIRLSAVAQSSEKIDMLEVLRKNNE